MKKDLNKIVNEETSDEICLYCGKELHTCERDESVNNSYLRFNGIEDKYGNWFCNNLCYKEAERIKKKLEEITPYQEKFKTYKSVTELCAENPNLLEYIEQLEKEIEKLKNSAEKFAVFKKRLALLIKEDYIDNWLKTPNNFFNGRKPIELANEGNFDPLFKMLHKLECGELH